MLEKKQIELIDGLDSREFLAIDIKHSQIIFDKLKLEILQGQKLLELAKKKIKYRENWTISDTYNAIRLDEIKTLLEESKK